MVSETRVAISATKSPHLAGQAFLLPGPPCQKLGSERQSGSSSYGLGVARSKWEVRSRVSADRPADLEILCKSGNA